MNRRGFITGIIALAAAPAIVRVGSLMPVKPVLTHEEIMERALAILARQMDQSMFSIAARLERDAMTYGTAIYFCSTHTNTGAATLRIRRVDPFVVRIAT